MPSTNHDPRAEESSADRQLAIEAPSTSRVDEPTGIRITGARPGATVGFEAAMPDQDGVTWRSTATFEADEAGRVDLTEQAPTSGSYEGVRPMGWCWSMATRDDQPVTALMTPADKTIRLRASTDDRESERTITRVVAGDGVTRHDVDEPVVGTAFEPAGDGPHPGVLVLHGSNGRPATFRAGLLATRGFATVAVRYFGEPDPLPDTIERVPLPYFDDVASWFADRSFVADGPLGVFGHSWGALAALQLGVRHDWVGAVVSYAGSGVVWDTPEGEPAWLDADGEPVAYVSGRGKPTLREGQLDAADADRRRAATISVEETDAPVLLVSGAEDPIWPCRRLSAIAADRLRRFDVDHAFDHLSYDDAGHFVTPPYLPKTDRVLGGTPGGVARADVDAWPRALDYLRRGLEAERIDTDASADTNLNTDT